MSLIAVGKYPSHGKKSPTGSIDRRESPGPPQQVSAHLPSASQTHSETWERLITLDRTVSDEEKNEYSVPPALPFSF